ncbi:MAG: LEA type 2 family protein [Phycisphaerales bacterium JB059]
MRTLARTLIAFAALALLLPTLGCETLGSVLEGLDKPRASIASARLSDLDAQSVTLDFDVEVLNPYNVPLPLTALRYDLASAGAPFLTGEAPLTGSVPARGRKTVTLPTRVAFNDLLAALSGVRPGQVVPYDAGLTLSVDAPGLGPIELPLRQSGELPVPAPPAVSLASLDWDELSLTNARALMRLDVTNTNDFRLDLGALDTALKLAGRDIGQTSIRDALRHGAGETGSLEVPIAFSPVSLGASILAVLRGDSADYAIDGAVRGATPFGPIELPFERTGRAPLTGG